MIRQLNNSLDDHQLLLSFLHLVDKDFEVPLSSKTDLSEYASKVLNFGCVLVFIEDNEIISCRIFYCNDLEKKIAYGSMMSTLPQGRGKGYAKLLIKEMIKICRYKGCKSVISSSVNPKAISIYKSIGYNVIEEELEGDKKKVILEYILS